MEIVMIKTSQLLTVALILIWLYITYVVCKLYKGESMKERYKRLLEAGVISHSQIADKLMVNRSTVWRWYERDFNIKDTNALRMLDKILKDMEK